MRGAQVAERATIFLNGKFTAQHLTGTQRVARELIGALDRLLVVFQGRTTPRIVLVCPAAGDAPDLERIEIRRIGRPRLSLHAWEQLHLPWHARSGLLINLSGSAPLLGRRQFCMIHDAAVFERPHAYTPPFRVWYRFLFRSLARRSERLFTVSRFSQGRLSAHLGIEPGALEVLPNGADHVHAVQEESSILARLGLRGRDYLLAVGGANPNKNILRLRQAFGAARHARGMKLVIVGGMNRKVFGAEAVDGFLASEDVVITGPLADASLKTLYGSAVGLVYPSTYEGFGIPPLEAMNCACPVLASNAASIPDVCGDAALYFDPYSVESIRESIDRLVAESGLRDDLIGRGLRHAGAFTWERAARALLERIVAAP